MPADRGPVAPTEGSCLPCKEPGEWLTLCPAKQVLRSRPRISERARSSRALPQEVNASGSGVGREWRPDDHLPFCEQGRVYRVRLPALERIAFLCQECCALAARVGDRR